MESEGGQIDNGGGSSCYEIIRTMKGRKGFMVVFRWIWVYDNWMGEGLRR